MSRPHFVVLWELLFLNMYPLRLFFTISNRTSFTYRRIFALKLSVQHYEKISPFYFLSVTISYFLPWSKAAKCGRRSWGVFGIWVLMLSSIPSISSWSWTQALQVIWLFLQFVSAWYGWTSIINYKKLTDSLWDTMIRLLVFIFLPYSQWRHDSFKVKTA